MVEQKISKKTNLWLGVFVLVMSVIYILVTIGQTAWINWIAMVWGFFLGGFLLIEGQIIAYFREKRYRKLTVGDFVVFASLIFGVVIIINSFLLIGILQESAPSWLVSFATTMGMRPVEYYRIESGFDKPKDAHWLHDLIVKLGIDFEGADAKELVRLWNEPFVMQKMSEGGRIVHATKRIGDSLAKTSCAEI